MSGVCTQQRPMRPLRLTALKLCLLVLWLTAHQHRKAISVKKYHFKQGHICHICQIALLCLIIIHVTLHFTSNRWFWILKQIETKIPRYLSETGVFFIVNCLTLCLWFVTILMYILVYRAWFERLSMNMHTTYAIAWINLNTINNSTYTVSKQTNTQLKTIYSLQCL